MSGISESYQSTYVWKPVSERWPRFCWVLAASYRWVADGGWAEGEDAHDVLQHDVSTKEPVMVRGEGAPRLMVPVTGSCAAMMSPQQIECVAVLFICFGAFTQQWLAGNTKLSLKGCQILLISAGAYKLLRFKLCWREIGNTPQQSAPSLPDV